MKKRLTAFLFFTALAVGANAQEKFIIKGKLTGLSADAKVMLNYRDGDTRKSDSTVTKQGSFELQGMITDPTKATIELKPLTLDTGSFDLNKYLSRDVTEFFIEGGTISINGASLKKATIQGGKAQQDFLQLLALLKPLQDKMNPLSEKVRRFYKEGLEDSAKSLFPQLRAIRADMNKVERDFMLSHGNSFVTLSNLQEMSSVIELPYFEPLYIALSNSMKQTATGKLLGEKLALARKTGVGQPALDFTQNNTEGVPVSLASLKGKYVLIDFWASWCGPCRAENPNVVKAYNEFKDKNFEIIGVSLDDKKEPWLQAIQKDGLPWIHVSDLNGWENAVAVEYGIKAVPQNLLLDPNGIIIAKNLRGEALSGKLRELIKTKDR